MTRPSKNRTRRLRVASLLTALAVGVGLMLVAAPAHAAYSTVQKAHGGKLQACKRPATRDGVRGFVVRVRIDNRAARHTHLGGMSRYRDGRERAQVSVRAAGGRVSSAKQLFFNPRRDLLSMGMGETDGTGAGGDVGLGSLRRC